MLLTNLRIYLNLFNDILVLSKTNSIIHEVSDLYLHFSHVLTEIAQRTSIHLEFLYKIVDYLREPEIFEFDYNILNEEEEIYKTFSNLVEKICSVMIRNDSNLGNFFEKSRRLLLDCGIMTNLKFSNHQLNFKISNHLKFLLKSFGSQDVCVTIARMAKNEQIHFPYKKYLVENQDCFFRKFVPAKFFETQKRIPLNFKTQNYLIEHLEEQFVCEIENNQKINVVEFLQEDFYLKLKFNGENSVIDWWLNENNTSILIHSILENESKLDTLIIRKELSKLVSQWEPIPTDIILFIMSKLNAKKILDICSGLGEVIFSSIHNPETQKYLGFQTNKRLRDGYEIIFGEMQKKLDVKHSTFLEYQISSSNSEFDFVFLAVPCFDFQFDKNYENNLPLNQQITLIINSLFKAWKNLEIGGFLVLYFDDLFNHFIEPINLFIKALFLGSSFKSLFWFKNEEQIKNSLWIWSKNSISLQTESENQEQQQITKNIFSLLATHFPEMSNLYNQLLSEK